MRGHQWDCVFVRRVEERLRDYLEEVFGLDPKKMKWIQIATPNRGKKPWPRSSCCMWAIGGRNAELRLVVWKSYVHDVHIRHYLYDTMT